MVLRLFCVLVTWLKATTRKPQVYYPVRPRWSNAWNPTHTVIYSCLGQFQYFNGHYSCCVQPAQSPTSPPPGCKLFSSWRWPYPPSTLSVSFRYRLFNTSYSCCLLVQCMCLAKLYSMWPILYSQLVWAYHLDSKRLPEGENVRILVNST